MVDETEFSGMDDEQDDGGDAFDRKLPVKPWCCELDRALVTTEKYARGLENEVARHARELASRDGAEPVAWMYQSADKLISNISPWQLKPTDLRNGWTETPLYSRPPASFQHRVLPWLIECFGQKIANDTIERNHRFLEESLELVQSCVCTASEAHQLVDYVFGRPVGEKQQEAGGVMVTLAALCLAQGLDMHEAGEVELERIWPLVEKIRAKQSAKPKHSPLPQ